jgi:plastocyanin
MRRRIPIAAVAAAALLAPAGAAAQDYPPASDPGRVAPRPKGPFETHTVCKQRGRCDFRAVQAAVNAADAGDTIRVRPGVYREAVRIDGRRKRHLRLIGDRRRPGRVVLDGRDRKQNGVAVNNADEVSVSGFKARNYRANGFYFTNVNGYSMANLIAERTGTYGLFAFNSIGGRITDSEAYYVNDGAFYVGQTPPQTRPKQTIVRNVDGWGSAIGFSGTNMRYVTITRSRFYNNAVGIVPNALDSEEFPPAERNVIVDNEIFWNNFDFRRGDPPFKPRMTGTGPLWPPGTGILLLGGRDHLIERNRIYGNWLAGVAAIDGILVVEHPEAASLDRNVVRNNEFGLGGRDLNGRDLVYDGSGSDNCFSLDGVGVTVPEDRSTFAACSGPNGMQPAVRSTMLSWIGANAVPNWIRHPHAPKRGLRPIEVFSRRATASAAVVRNRTIQVGDNFFAPDRPSVKRGTTVVWRWPGADEAGDVHDVKLVSGPKGVRRFHSEAAATGYTFRRRLRVPGRYRIVCTFHTEMRMTIRVRR